MTMAAHDASARWRTFLEEAKESEVMTLLSRQTNFPYLSIPFHEIQTFDPEFAEDVLEHPKQILSAGSKTLMEICRERGGDRCLATGRRASWRHKDAPTRDR